MTLLLAPFPAQASTFQFQGSSGFTISGSFTAVDHDRDGWISASEVQSYSLIAGNLNYGSGQWGLRLDSSAPGDTFAQIRYQIGSHRLINATFGARSTKSCGYSFPGPETGSVTVATVFGINGQDASFRHPTSPTSSYGDFTYCWEYATENLISWSSDVTVAERLVGPEQPPSVPLPPALAFLLTGAGLLGVLRRVNRLRVRP